MSPRSAPIQPGSYYHIYNRGVSGQPIFFCPENWVYFIQLMRKYFKEDLVEIVAYCLMPTHYHILAYIKTEHFSDHVMQPFATSYAKSINKQENREGPLFQNRFQSKPVTKQEYLISLTRYIHLNPEQAGLVTNPEDWIFSSYRDFIGMRSGTLPKYEIILSAFNSRQEYRIFVEEGRTSAFDDIRAYVIE